MSHASPVVLVVEHDQAFAALAADWLARRSYSPVIAASAGDAAAALGGAPPAVIVAAADPQTFAGTCAALRTAFPDAPIVAVVRGDDPAAEAIALSNGALDVIAAPAATPAYLARVVRYALEQRRQSEMARHQEEALESIFNASPLPIVMLDSSRRVRMWNAAAERMFGWSASEVIGGDLPYVRPETAAGVQSRFEKALGGGTVLGQETTALRKDGVVIDISVAASPLCERSGRVVGVTAIYKDITDRKNAERALRASEERYRLLFETNPQPMLVFDRETLRFLAVNERAEQVYGYARDEFLTRTLLDIRPAEDAEPTRERVAGLHGSVIKAGTRHMRKDGAILSVLVSSHAIEFLGRAARVMTVEDITEQAAAGQRLEFLSAASAALHSADMDGSLRTVATLGAQTMAEVMAVLLSDGAAQVERIVVGHRDPAVQAELRAVVDARLRQSAAVPERIREALANPAPVLTRVTDESAPGYVPRAVLRLLRPLGSLMVVPLSTVSRQHGVMVLAADRSTRSYDERDLTAMEELARRISLMIENAALMREARELFDADLTGNFVATPDGRITHSNAEFLRMLRHDDPGTCSAAAIFGGDAWREFVHGMEREQRVRQREVQLYARDGGPVHVLLSATGLFNERGALVSVRGQLYDLSAHKHLEEQFSQAQKMEAVGRLAGGVAHDFNNLLTIISGRAERLIEMARPDSEVARDADAIATAAGRAASLTQQLLAFSRRQVLAPKIIDVDNAVRATHRMLERLIGEDVHCELSLQSGGHTVRADPMRLEQAILNLAVNARDAMPNGGTLTISTSVATVDEAYSRQHIGMPPGDYLQLAVSDTGTGMNAETRARVFEPFFTTKGVGKGTGLGLSTVYGIVKQSGGYIWVYSELGLGTTFKIYLPLAASEADADGVAAAPVVPARGTETILLVEDEEGVRELIQDLLTAQGYKVLAASRGAEALQISEFTEDEIKLLVTDVVMPHMSGRELAMRLKARRPAVKVLFLSGYTDDAIAHHGVLEPGAAFLQKPFAGAQLARKVREVLESQPVE